MSPREHLDVIIEGLPQDYEATIALICGRSDPISISIVETLLLGHESRLIHFNKLATASANIAVASSTASKQDKSSSTNSVQAFVAQSTDSNSDDSSTGWRGSRGDNGGRGGHGSRGRGRNGTQCQVCHKFGHEASICFHRFKRDYNVAASSLNELLLLRRGLHRPLTILFLRFGSNCFNLLKAMLLALNSYLNSLWHHTMGHNSPCPLGSLPPLCLARLKLSLLL